RMFGFFVAIASRYPSVQCLRSLRADRGEWRRHSLAERSAKAPPGRERRAPGSARFSGTDSDRAGRIDGLKPDGLTAHGDRSPCVVTRAAGEQAASGDPGRDVGHEIARKPNRLLMKTFCASLTCLGLMLLQPLEAQSPKAVPADPL